MSESSKIAILIKNFGNFAKAKHETAADALERISNLAQHYKIQLTEIHGLMQIQEEDHLRTKNCYHAKKAELETEQWQRQYFEKKYYALLEQKREEEKK